MRLGLLAGLALAVAAGATLAARGAALPLCRAEGYGLAEPSATKGPAAVSLTVGWLSAKEHRRPCLLQTTIDITVDGPTGAAGATAEWHVNAVLRPWSNVVHTWSWQNWCTNGSAGDPVVTVTDEAGSKHQRTVSDPPGCTDSGAATSLAEVGGGTTYVKRPDKPIRPHILRKGTPPSLHAAVITPKNAWIASDGYTLVVVYAGRPGVHPSIGRFAVIRQNLVFGVQYNPPDIVDVGKTGAIRITSTPHGSATSVQRGRIGFVAADGTTGFLDLRDDTVRITKRRR